MFMYIHHKHITDKHVKNALANMLFLQEKQKINSKISSMLKAKAFDLFLHRECNEKEIITMGSRRAVNIVN